MCTPTTAQRSEELSNNLCNEQVWQNSLLGKLHQVCIAKTFQPGDVIVERGAPHETPTGPRQYPLPPTKYLLPPYSSTPYLLPPPPFPAVERGGNNSKNMEKMALKMDQGKNLALTVCSVPYSFETLHPKSAWGLGIRRQGATDEGYGSGRQGA